MTSESALAVSCDVHLAAGRRGRTRLESEPAPPPRSVIPGKVPRVSRVMALAVHFDQLIRSGEVRDYTDLAGLTGLSRPRITQIMNLLHLAPDVQEEILFLPRTVSGYDPIVERDLWPLTRMVGWNDQRATWRKAILRTAPSSSASQPRARPKTSSRVISPRAKREPRG